MSDTGLSKYLPEQTAWLRALVSSIPTVGGALDHLVFDKADGIRAKNVEICLQALGVRLNDAEERSIDKEWFQSEEALGILRLVVERVSFEQDKRKIRDLGMVAAVCGMHPQSGDDKKLSVVDHLGRLTSLQIRLLGVLSRVQPQTKILSGGDINQTVTGIWREDIKKALQSGTRFWEGTLTLDLELDILESMNTIRRIPTMVSPEPAYTLTGLGRQAAGYVQLAGT